MELQLRVTFERVFVAVQAQLDVDTAQFSPVIDARLVSFKHPPGWQVRQLEGALWQRGRERGRGESVHWFRTRAFTCH